MGDKMAKEICRYGVMSNNKRSIKCKKCDSMCVYCYLCGACGEAVMLKDYMNKCKVFYKKKEE